MRPNLFYPAGCLFRLAWVTLLIMAVLALLKQFVFDIMPVSGLSMFPTYHDKDVIILNKINYLVTSPKRGDSIVLRFPGDPDHSRYIKRIVGLPGEKVSINEGRVFINDKLLNEAYIGSDIQTVPPLVVTLKSDQYYLLGDNRPVSSDSRIWGTATRDDFIGKAFFIILPLKDFQAILSPIY